MTDQKQPAVAELLAPAGNFETALAAFAAGADAVYCGLSDFSARAFADNFTLDELRQLVRYAAKNHRRVYVTFNTLIDETDLESAVEQLSRLEAVGPDGVIVQDLGVARLCREFFPGLALHASTQLVAHNLEGVLALKEIGFKRVVLARELSFAEIESIKKRCGGVELETFIHGALCYSVSGLCLYGAMEKGRSGNRGKCPYLCRQCLGGRYPFSMKDLRLGADVRRLADLGVASLKIEGRMKSPLYVASVVRWYRQYLGGGAANLPRVTEADLETVFSRRTTDLRFNGDNEAVIDAESLGHRGTPIGQVKRVTKDREGRAWLRFHTLRALEKHDGLQFDALTDEGRHFGFGISEMRSAISRAPVFEVAAGADVEILLPDAEACPLRPGDTVYCSMSNAVKRAFPAPAFRDSDYPGVDAINVALTLAADRISASATLSAAAESVTASAAGEFSPAKNPEKTRAAAEKAFSKLGGTDYFLASLKLVDPEKRFAPASVLNDLRRDLVEALDAARERQRVKKVDAALAAAADFSAAPAPASPAPAVSGAAAILPRTTLKLRLGQRVPVGEWGEIIVAVSPAAAAGPDDPLAALPRDRRLALPVWTGELDFNRLRNFVKRALRGGFTKWECADLATLRLLRQLGVEDITADWSLYAFNSAALAELAALGVRRFTASPENHAENLVFLAESGYAVEFLKQQSTPLFISLHRNAEYESDAITTFERDGLFITVARRPRLFTPPASAATTRIDLSWDPVI